MTKYQQYLQDMLSQNKELFDNFSEIHKQYTENPKYYQKKFNEIGYIVQDVIRRYENRLCSQSEGSGYGKYSSKLSEKFHQEIRKIFPKIDFIGVL